MRALGERDDFAMTSILRYAARVKARTNRRATKMLVRNKPAITLVGTGKLASFLALALAEAGYRIPEIVGRQRARSMRRAQALARRVGARATPLDRARLDAEVLWLAVPDDEIRHVAGKLARRMQQCPVAPNAKRSPKIAASSFLRCAFHSSGALASCELESLRNAGVAVASVHPLMTFVQKATPSLSGVPFAVEGDRNAVRIARAIVRELGGDSFPFPAGRKAAYHAWATMTSPLLIAYLVTLEEAGRAAGLSGAKARRMSLPIVRETLENYARLGPANSFSGPFVRGDTVTVAKHLSLLKRRPRTHAVYLALAQIALDSLPVKNRSRLHRLLGTP